MTLAMSVLRPNRVVMIADAVRTFDGTMALEPTSFGEAPAVDGYQCAQESACKVFRLASALCTFAGDDRHGMAFLDVMRRQIERGDRVSSAFSSAARSVVPLSEYVTVAAGFVDSGRAKLLTFNQKGCCEITEVACSPEQPVLASMLGSAAAAQRSFASLAVHQVSGMAPEPLQLVLPIAVMQVFGMQYPTMQSGVGGTYHGGLVSACGVEWQPDLLYLVRKPGGLDIVSCRIREDALHVLAINDGKTTKRSFVNAFTEEQRERWSVPYAAPPEYYDGTSWEYAIVCNGSSMALAVIDIRDGSDLPPLLRVRAEKTERGTIHFETTIGFELEKLLDEPLTQKENAIPFRCLWYQTDRPLLEGYQGSVAHDPNQAPPFP